MALNPGESQDNPLNCTVLSLLIPPSEAARGHCHKRRQPRLSYSNSRNTLRYPLQHVLKPDSPAVNGEPARALFATPMGTGLPWGHKRGSLMYRSKLERNAKRRTAFRGNTMDSTDITT